MLNIFDVILAEVFESYKDRVVYKDKSLVIGVIDSIFSIGVRYGSVIKAVNRFVKLAGIEREKDKYTVSDFFNHFGHLNGEELANDVFNNRNRTSAKNGILKTEAIKQVLKIFKDCGIETQDDLIHHPRLDEVERHVKMVKGQGSGISFQYIMMHAGDKNRFKPDRQIYWFFQDLLGYGKLNEKELYEAFYKELEIVNKRYPYFDARSFDSLIWEFMTRKQ
jgi:hypothetical protein